MLAEFSRSSADRTKLVAYREISARVAILATLAIAPAILHGAGTQSAGFHLVGVVFGGLILASMDRIAAVIANRHAAGPCVTVGVDVTPIDLHDADQIEARHAPLAAS